uniref:Cytochrome P450 n=1 Tax=Salix viminalis TaxID=40686 RepID=A0A6N2MGF1_SALVM
MAAMTVVQYVIALFVLWFITVFLQYIFKRPGKKPAGYCLPPSPPTLPLIGHLHLLTPVAYKGFHALNNKYGPLLYLRFATYPAVLVSSAPVATEIFKAQDVHFASRIKSPFEDNLLFGSSTSFFNAPYGDYWKFMKKICMTELLGSSQMKKLKNVRHEEAVRFLSKMLEKGEKNDVADLSAEVLTLANNATCRMIMSARCSGKDNQADQCRELVLRKKIADVPKKYDELFESILVDHEENAKRGDTHMENKDLMDILLEVYHDKNAEMRITRKQMKTFFLDLFTGGTSTTADAILWILGSLHAFQACVKEAMRLHPPVPLFDRVCRENCKLAGHDIPKGITMIMNAYSIMRDPKIWDNPNDFIPERFLTENENTKGQNLQIYVPFGGEGECALGQTSLQLWFSVLIGRWSVEMAQMDRKLTWTLKQKKNLSMYASVLPVYLYRSAYLILSICSRNKPSFSVAGNSDDVSSSSSSPLVFHQVAGTGTEICPLSLAL